MGILNIGDDVIVVFVAPEPSTSPITWHIVGGTQKLAAEYINEYIIEQMCLLKCMLYA